MLLLGPKSATLLQNLIKPNTEELKELKGTYAVESSNLGPLEVGTTESSPRVGACLRV